MAHSISNPHIIHMIKDVKVISYGGIPSRDPGVRYLCIGACYPTPEKSTREPTEVTCKNCLRELER